MVPASSSKSAITLSSSAGWRESDGSDAMIADASEKAEVIRLESSQDSARLRRMPPL